MVSKSNQVICNDNFGNRYETPVEELTFRPSVYGVIIRDHKILLVPQWDGYDLPGGGVEKGESLEVALARECKEETGLDVRVKELIDCQTSFYRSIKGTNYQSILAYFLCEIVGGDLAEQQLDEYEKEYAKKAEWINLDQINTIKYMSTADTVRVIKKSLQ